MAKSNSLNLNAVKLAAVAVMLCFGHGVVLAASVAGTPRVAERQSIVSMKGVAAMQSNPAFTNFIARGTTNAVPPLLLPPRLTQHGGGDGIVAASDALITAASAGTTVRTSPPPAVSFQALPDNMNVIPPDTHGAVGPNHVMTVLNSQVRIQDRVGNVKSTVSLPLFWLTLGITRAFDPKVYYDASADRWIFVTIADPFSPSSGVLLAVSQSSDPEGNWFLYLFDGDASDTMWVDYPSVGFNKDWIVVSVNMFPITSLNGEVRLFVVDKANVYGNGPGRFTLFQEPDAFTMVPAVTHDENLSTMYLVDDPSLTYNTIIAQDSSGLRVSTITGQVGAEILTMGVASVNPQTQWQYFQPIFYGSLPQLGDTRRISANDARVQHVVYRNDSLWATHTAFLPLGVATHSVAQWYQFTPSGQLQQFGRVEDTNGLVSYAFPSIAVNSVDDVLLGFSRFSPTTYASAAYAFRSKSDPTNTMQVDRVLKAGEASYVKAFSGPRNRWGDYSATMVDPSNDLDMWTIQEYAMTPLAGQSRWGTWWGMVSASGGARFDLPAYTVSEVGPPGEAIITVINSAGTPGTVDWLITGGTALAGSNYFSAMSGTLTFINGQTTESFPIGIVDDFEVNTDRTIELTLTNAQGGLTLGYLTNAVLTIVDDETKTVVSEAGEFNFSAWIDSQGLDPYYYGTMNETDFDFFCYPGNFVDRERSPLGMLVTVVRTNGSKGKVMVDYRTVDNGLALPFCDYTPVSGTLVFDEFQTSTNFLVPLRNVQNLLTNNQCLFSFFFSSNYLSFINIELSNPRPAPEEEAARPGLIRPTLGQGSLSGLVLYDVGLGVPTFTFTPTNFISTFVNGVAFERLHYRFDEYRGRDPRTTNAMNTVRVSILNPFAVGGTIHLVAFQHARGGGWGAINNFPFGAAGSTLTLLGQHVLEAGSDFAASPLNGTEILSNPKFTDGTFANGFINGDDYVPIDVRAIGFGGCRQQTIVEILNDTTVEFNEDIFLALVRLPGDLPVNPFASIANVTILYKDQPAGALDREWNPDNVEGTPDRSFNLTPGANNIVNTVVVQPWDNKTLLAGDFTAVNTKSRNRIARMNADGSVDISFTPGTGSDGSISTMLLYPANITALAGRIVIGGGFSSYNGTARNGLVRLLPNGAIDPSFVIGNGANGTVRTMAMQADGKVVIAGDFTEYNNVTRNGLARINLDGSLDTGFDPGSGADSLIWSIAIASGGKILIGGDFTSYQGEERSRIALLNPANGALDTTFDPGGGANNSVYAVGVQPDGLIIMAGAFDEVDARRRVGIARLMTNGVLDTSFDSGTGPNNPIYSLTLQVDGKALVGGPFTSYNGTRRMGLARLRYDGTVDTSFLDTAYNQFAGLVNAFSFEPPNYVNSIAVQPDGNIMIGGSFHSVGGNPSFTADVKNHWSQFERNEKRARWNIARLIGGATPGPGNMEFEVDDYTVDENGGVASVKLERVDGRLGTIVASAGTADRTTSVGLDFVNTNLVTLWPEAFYQTNINITFPILFPTNFAPISVGKVDPIYLRVPLLDDGFREGDEAVDLSFLQPQGSITLGGDVIPVGAALGRSKARLTILDNDFDAGTFMFSSANYFTNENALRATITVIRVNGANGSASVDYFTSNETSAPRATAGTGPGGDYSPASGRLNFASGQTFATFTVTIVNDTQVEFDENVGLVLTNAAGAKLPGGTPTSIATSMLTIVDNDFPQGRLNFATTTFTNSESDTFATITVTRSSGNSSAISVDYQTLGGTATPGADYTTTSGTLVWNSGDSVNKTFTVPLAVDGLAEGTESFSVRLFNGRVGGLLNTNLLALRTNSLVAILDGDAYGSVAFGQPFFMADENGGSALITVVRTGGIAGTGTVSYATAPGSAQPLLHYYETNGVLTFLPGEISKTFTVGLVDDQSDGGNKILGLLLSGASNVTLGIPAAADLRIVDDESFNEPAGSLDTLFGQNVQANGPLFSMALQMTNGISDGRIIVAGDFTDFNQVVRNRLARLMTNGSLDATFDPGPGANDAIRTIAAQRDGRLLIGGFFTQVISTNRNRIARLNIDGSVDGTFNPGAGADGPVLALAVQPDDRILAAGTFSAFNSIPRPGIVRLNTNGMVDLTFNPGTGANGPVYAVALQSNGKVLIGGEFSAVNGIANNRIARLNSNGSVDTTFNAGVGANDSVRSILFQPDGKIVIGGSFTSVGGSTRSRVARLNNDGTLDTGFMASASGANGSVFTMALQGDGRVVVGGDFTRFNNVTRNRLTRLNTDGSNDPTINFGSGADAFVATLLIQPDRKIVLGGGFTTYDGERRLRIARIHGGSIFGPGSLEFSRFEFLAGEGSTNGLVTVRRRGGTVGAVGVNFETSDGSAVAGVDYQTAAGTLSFPEAETFQSFVVPILDNFTPQGDRSLNLTLLNGSYTGGAVPGSQPFATLRILDDEGTVGFAAANFTENEGVPSQLAAISVVRSGATNGPVTVRFATTNLGSTATVPFDYLSTNGTLTFLPGEVTKTFQIRLVDDLNGEGSETVQLVLSNPSNSNTLSIATAVLLITDNEFAPGAFTFGATSYSTNENRTNAQLTILRLNGSSGLATITYRTVDGTAIGGQDYTATNVILAFADGEVSKTIFIGLIDDLLVESAETFGMVLSKPTGSATLGTTTNLLVTIVDNDVSTIENAGATLISESLTNNSIIDPGETVTMSFALRNIGSGNTVNLIGTLLTGNGVINPSGAQNYGVLLAGGLSAARTFTFTANGVVGDRLDAVLQLIDNGVTNPAVTFSFTIGGQAARSFTSTNRIVINDATTAGASAASPYPSVIDVANLGGTITRLSVTITNFTHKAPGDVDVLLVGPSGQRVMLMSDAGNASVINVNKSVTNLTFRFMDSGTNTLPVTNRLQNGTYQCVNYAYQGPGLPPTSDVFLSPVVQPIPLPPSAASQPYTNTSFAVFNTVTPNGAWSLFVMDDTRDDEGSIGGWSLHIETSDPIVAAGGLSLADVAISAAPASSTVILDGNVTTVLTITNRGPSPALNVAVLDQMAAGLTLISTTPSVGTCNKVQNTLTWTVGTLQPGGSARLTLVTRPAALGQYTSSATVAASQADPNLANNTVVLNTTAITRPVLAISRVNNTLTLSWAANSGYRLQVADTLVPANWSDVTDTPQVLNSQNVLSYGAAGAGKFYRLRAP